MYSHLPPHELAGVVARWGERQARVRQVAKRQYELAPLRLKQIEREYRLRYSSGKAHRLALKDERYLAFLEKTVELNSSALEARIQWETHRMLYEARLSLQSFQRVVYLFHSQQSSVQNS